MSLKIIERSILPLLIATLIVGGFFWKFTDIYTFIIEQFTDKKLFVLYSHLFIFTFLTLALFISIVNLINHFVLQSKIFVLATILPLLLFYLLSYEIIAQQITYFIHYPLSANSIMAMVLFVVGILSYALYSIIVVFFNRFIPLSFVLLFTALALLYSAGFIDTFCYPIVHFIENLQ
jgi:hypothetical protein